MVSTGIRPGAGDGNSNPLMGKRPPRLTAARLALQLLAGLLLLLVLVVLMLE